MKIWNQAPLVRLILPFIAGILAAIQYAVPSAGLAPVLSVLILIVAGIVLIPKLHIAYKNSWWFGFLVNALLFIVAYQITISKTEKFSPHHFSRYTEKNAFVIAKLNKTAIEKDRSFKISAEILAVKCGDHWRNTIGNAMLYLKKDERSAALKYGDELILNGNFQEIKSPQNPEEFNYQRFLAFHSIYQQVYASEKNWRPLHINEGNPVLTGSYTLRDELLNTLSENKISGDEYAVGAALMLGYGDKLDADIIQAYSNTGALHILSVSGLHVAIVYVVFNWLLFFFDKFKYGSIIKAILLIFLLWFYSALTGLSPSVLRAATMFSFIIIAKSFNRHTNIYNTLAASAFLLLVIDPYLIMEVGFQLSYIAVIGIVYIQPKIYRHFSFDNWLADQAWSMTSVSIAAQIATFPLGLFYFHQFPNYFLLSNFIVIPVSTLIIYLGIGLFLLGKLSVVAGYLAWIFGKAVWLLNATVKEIEQWPYAVMEGISISFWEACLLYGMVIFCFYYFSRRRMKYLLYALGMIILILFSQMFEQREQAVQQQLIVYNIPKKSLINFINGRSSELLADTSFAKDKNAILFHIKQNWWKLGISHSDIFSGNIRTNDLLVQNGMIQFRKKRIVRINSADQMKATIDKPLKIDYLIISEDPEIKIADLLNNYKPGKIIFDSSNSAYRLKCWSKECITCSQAFYSVTDSGAFVENI